MRIAILTEVYPSIDKPDQRAFIHARACLYQQAGDDVHVFKEGLIADQQSDRFEGIQITYAKPEVLSREIRAWTPDVIAFHTPYAGTPIFQLATQLVKDFPIVAWIHGYEAMYTAFHGYHQGWRRWASVPWDTRKLWQLRHFLRQCAGVVYVSQWIRQIAESGMRYRHPQSEVIHNPVDTIKFAPDSNQQEKQNRQPLQGISLRSLGPKYGLDIAVQAYSGLPDTELTIIGTGPLEQKLRSLINRTQSHTTLLVQGYPHIQVPQVLRQYDYFVAPSRNETQGVAMCEAMACGLPVVATRVGGIPEFVRDGVDGYLVPPEDASALRTAIEVLIKNPDHIRQMGNNARQRIIDICDGEKVVQLEVQILTQVINNSRINILE